MILFQVVVFHSGLESMGQTMRTNWETPSCLLSHLLHFSFVCARQTVVCSPFTRRNTKFRLKERVVACNHYFFSHNNNNNNDYDNFQMHSYNWILAGLLDVYYYFTILMSYLSIAFSLCSWMDQCYLSGREKTILHPMHVLQLSSLEFLFN